MHARICNDEHHPPRSVAQLLCACVEISSFPRRARQHLSTCRLPAMFRAVNLLWGVSHANEQLLNVHISIYISGFLNLGMTDILGQIILCCGGCPMHYRIFNSICVSVSRCPSHSSSTAGLKMSFNVAKCSVWVKSPSLILVEKQFHNSFITIYPHVSVKVGCYLHHWRNLT